MEGVGGAGGESKFLGGGDRLDRETSGLLVLAKKRSALTALHAALREGKVRKCYLALVKGRWRDDKRRVDLPLKKYLTRSGERRGSGGPAGPEYPTPFRRPAAFRGLNFLSAELLSPPTPLNPAPLP